ncbi:MAG: ABC transporter ATP-binding protein [Microbacteriaceae bacterium]|nr:MAG: ABC transporter ATP-binding protein [Microbacteriaceae bacterium]
MPEAAGGLAVEKLEAGYGKMRVLHGVSLHVEPGEILALLGPNGAGKTTLLRCVSGLVPATAGRVQVAGADHTGAGARRMVHAGVAQVPEGRLLFGEMSVRDNLLIGAFSNGRANVARNFDRMIARFPILGERRKQPVRTLSGGEQQMVAIARALMSEPRFLLLDEPSTGLAPRIVEEIGRQMTEEAARARTGVILVEQNTQLALSVADRVCVLVRGRIVHQGSVDEFRDPSVLSELFLT